MTALARAAASRAGGRLRAMLTRAPAATVLVLALAALLPVVASQAAAWAERSALEQVAARAQRTLELARAGLASEIRRHEAIPQLLAVDRAVIEFLSRPRDDAATAAMNVRLASVNRIVGSSDTYLMDTRGLTLAASNFDSPTPFVGRNFGYRPYFTDALGGGLGRYFALGTTSGRRGYYFAAPVRDASRVLGVVAVKVDVAPLERRWAAGREEILVSDSDGVVFMSSRPEWVLHSLAPLGAQARARIEASRRYDDAVIEPLQLREGEPLADGTRLLGVAGDAPRHLRVRAEMPESDWTLHVLADASPVRARVRAAVATAVFGFAFALLLLALVLQRRRAVRERLENAASAQLELERRVRERTAELVEANRQLTDEIAERAAAEAELKRTQRELIQASKLSALGEMSAGISHELNQPLAAIRSFAENAEEFIARGRTEDARSNLARIGALTERMARIIADLRTFARKDREAPGSVALAAAIDDALAVLDARIRREGVQVDRPQIAPPGCALAEPSRLQQVLVNVLTNSLDALRDRDQRTIRIDVHEQSGTIAIEIADNGPGIPPERINDIFDPFFTTKEVDEGLGLGLSISYGIVSGFGGSIRAGNRVDGGATFTITLPRAPASARPERIRHAR